MFFPIFFSCPFPIFPIHNFLSLAQRVSPNPRQMFSRKKGPSPNVFCFRFRSKTNSSNVETTLFLFSFFFSIGASPPCQNLLLLLLDLIEYKVKRVDTYGGRAQGNVITDKKRRQLRLVDVLVDVLQECCSVHTRCSFRSVSFQSLHTSSRFVLSLLHQAMRVVFLFLAIGEKKRTSYLECPIDVYNRMWPG